MTGELRIESLITFEIPEDGSHVRIKGNDADGCSSSVYFATDCMRQLVMSLPRIAQEAIKRQHRKNDLRLVYHASDWEIEATNDDDVILTLSTPDQFFVSFLFKRAAMESLCRSATAALEKLDGGPFRH